MFGKRDEIDVAVDRNRHAEPPRQLGAEGHVTLAEDRALPADARRALDDAGQTNANAGNIRSFQVSVADAAANAVLDQIGDHARRLPVDADRQRECCAARRRGSSKRRP